MGGRAFVGMSGFAYAQWKGRFYPEKIKPAEMLAYYAERFPTVEINYTFSRFPTEALLSGWAAKTPAGFAFALKAPRRITHELRLRDAGEPLARFLGPTPALGERLGPLLFQTPPTLGYKPATLDGFLASLPAGVRCAFEFRHPSWDSDEVRASLAKADAAWCVADTDETNAPMGPPAAGFAYLRLRRSEYPPEALNRWAASIQTLTEDGADVFCYLRHTDDGRGVVYAQDLLARLGRDP